MDLLNPAINDYLEDLTPKPHPILQEMQDYARQHRFPIVGPLVGRFLQQLAMAGGARRIFEMGSGYGYSALWIALALPEDAAIDCSEFDPENVARGKGFLERAGVADKVRWHQGDALQAITGVDGPFDMIVIDVDKEQYPESLQLAWPRLRRGGTMIIDNALWGGDVVSEEPPSESTAGVLQVTRDAYALPDAIATLIPLRDGLLTLVKT